VQQFTGSYCLLALKSKAGGISLHVIERVRFLPPLLFHSYLHLKENRVYLLLFFSTVAENLSVTTDEKYEATNSLSAHIKKCSYGATLVPFCLYQKFSF